MDQKLDAGGKTTPEANFLRDGPEPGTLAKPRSPDQADGAGQSLLGAGRGSRGFLGHPLGFWFIFWGELAERSSFYGMKAILTLYLVESSLRFTREQAGAIVSGFVFACYLLPLLGGFLADRFLGRYWSLVCFCVPYIAGHFILGMPTVPTVFLALALLALGTGVTKPNISTLMGMTYDQLRPGREKLRSDAFAMFYFAINVGSLLSSFSMPIVRNYWDYQVAFLFPAALMCIAFPIFALGKPFYAREVSVRKRKTVTERGRQWRVLGRLLGLFVVVAFFWGIFDQSSITWIYFAQDHIDLHLFGFAVRGDQFAWINPALILILLPLITILWRVLDRLGWRLRPTDKMAVGFLLATGTMAVMAVAGFLARTGASRLSPWWIVLAYLLVTCAEVCISVVGLELAFTAAPRPMKSVVAACWLLTVAGGNFGNMLVTPLYDRMPPGWYFGLLTGLMLVITGLFFLVARNFNRAAAQWQRDDAEADNEAQDLRPAQAAGDGIRTELPGTTGPV
jgi:POT family proton-dependent oligopeptide transporter